MIQDVAGEKALTVRIAPEVYQRLEQLAKQEKRSVSAQAAYLIERGIGRAAYVVTDDTGATIATMRENARGGLDISGLTSLPAIHDLANPPARNKDAVIQWFRENGYTVTAQFPND